MLRLLAAVVPRCRCGWCCTKMSRKRCKRGGIRVAISWAKTVSSPARSSASQSRAMYASPKPMRPLVPTRRYNACGRSSRITGSPGPPPPMIRPSGRRTRSTRRGTTRRNRLRAMAVCTGRCPGAGASRHGPVVAAPDRRTPVLPSSLASHSLLHRGRRTGNHGQSAQPQPDAQPDQRGHPLASQGVTQRPGEERRRPSVLDPRHGGPEDSSCPVPQRDVDAELVDRAVGR